nr:alcohol dehydrogenase [Quercus suber]
MALLPHMLPWIMFDRLFAFQKVCSWAWRCQASPPRSNVLTKTCPGISPAIGAVSSDAIMTAYHGIVRRAAVKKGELVFIFGLGGLGFNAIQIARAKGARVFVSDIRQSALDAAVEFGVAQEDVVPAGTKVPEWVKDNGLENQIDVVADFAGMEQTFSDAQQIGVKQDVAEGLEMVAEGKLRPQVETRPLEDFPEVLDDLHHGKIKSRMALVPSVYG